VAAHESELKQWTSGLPGAEFHITMLDLGGEFGGKIISLHEQ
jgi:hypothetical protein